jgi:hypothetical protein
MDRSRRAERFATRFAPSDQPQRSCQENQTHFEELQRPPKLQGSSRGRACRNFVGLVLFPRYVP